MKAVGIIIAKENSNRFPGKNYYLIQGKPMFMHNWELLNNCPLIQMTYIATDSPEIKRYFRNLPMAIIDRGVNISEDEQPFIEILKYAYYCIPERYDYIVTIMANSIGHTIDPILQGLSILESMPAVNEVRSFDEKGNQSGIFIFRTNNLPEKLYHQSAIISNGKEIHYKRELENERAILD